MRNLKYGNSSMKVKKKAIYQCLVPCWFTTVTCKQWVDCLQVMWEIGTETLDYCRRWKHLTFNRWRWKHLTFNHQRWKHLTHSVDTNSSISATASFKCLAIFYWTSAGRSLISKLHFCTHLKRKYSLGIQYKTMLHGCELDASWPGWPWYQVSHGTWPYYTTKTMLIF